MRQYTMYQYETATYKVSTSSADALKQYKHIVVSIKQKNNQVDLTEDRLTVDEEAGTITFRLTQEETAKFNSLENSYLQVNVLYNDSRRNVSSAVPITINGNIYKEVME